MRIRRFLLAALLLGLAADQIAQHTVLADDVFLGRFIAPFDPPVFTRAQRGYLDSVRQAVAGDAERATASQFDADLGWCPPPSTSSMGASYDALGARVGARPHALVPAPGQRRVVTIGGSFTMGMEVADLEAWPARVEAEDAGLEVINLGVAGYGVDQAYLRYARDGRPLEPAEVWVGLMPEAALRVSTQYAPTYHRWATMCAFKPRFVLDDAAPDGLRLVPSPARTLEDTLRLLTDQAAFFDALSASDTWVRRTPSAFAPRGSALWHHSAAGRIALTLYESRGRKRSTWLEDSDSEVYQVLRRLFAKLHAETSAAGARLRVVVVPSRPDLEQRARDGGAYWQGLTDDLRALGIDVLDTTAALEAQGGAEAPRLWMDHGHYSPLGNDVVASAVRAAWSP